MANNPVLGSAALKQAGAFDTPAARNAAIAAIPAASQSTAGLVKQAADSDVQSYTPRTPIAAIDPRQLGLVLANPPCAVITVTGAPTDGSVLSIYNPNTQTPIRIGLLYAGSSITPGASGGWDSLLAGTIYLGMSSAAVPEIFTINVASLVAGAIPGGSSGGAFIAGAIEFECVLSADSSILFADSGTLSTGGGTLVIGTSDNPSVDSVISYIITQLSSSSLGCTYGSDDTHITGTDTADAYGPYEYSGVCQQVQAGSPEGAASPSQSDVLSALMSGLNGYGFPANYYQVGNSILFIPFTPHRANQVWCRMLGNSDGGIYCTGPAAPITLQNQNIEGGSIQQLHCPGVELGDAVILNDPSGNNLELLQGAYVSLPDYITCYAQADTAAAIFTVIPALT